MLPYRKHTSRCLINKKGTELRSISGEKRDRKKIKTEWLRMSSRRLMIVRDERTR